MTSTLRLQRRLQTSLLLKKTHFRIFFPVQLTVVGLVGVDGIPVVKPVELVIKNVLEAARARRQVMAGKPAQEQRGKARSAIRIRVQVRRFRTHIQYIHPHDRNQPRSQGFSKPWERDWIEIRFL